MSYEVKDRRRVGMDGSRTGWEFPNQPSAASGYDGARPSAMRGFVYFPNLDTRTAVDTFSRVEMMRRARWLEANSGITKGCLDSAARLVVGRGLRPVAGSGDEEWDQEVERRWVEATGKPAVFDVSGKYTFARSQRIGVRNAMRDGDFFGVLSSSMAGRARMAFYEGHQVGQGKKRGEINGRTGRRPWHDGVKTDRMNRPQAYRFTGGESERTIGAENVLALMADDQVSARRGVTALHAALNHLVDISEISGLIKHGIKMSTEMGMVVEYDGGATGLGGGLMGGLTRTTQTKANGDSVDTLVREVFEPGSKLKEMNPGSHVKLLESQRPHPNTVEWIYFLVRDIAKGLGLPAELLWDISKLGGANTRFVLEDAQGFIEERQQLLIDSYLSRFWIYFVAKEMRYMGLREPRGGGNWWDHSWASPPRKTVDFGRDGKLYLQQLEEGAMSRKKWHAMHQEDWEDEGKQMARERVRRAIWLREEAAAQGLSVDEVLAVDSAKAPAPEVLEAAAEDVWGVLEDEN